MSKKEHVLVFDAKLIGDEFDYSPMYAEDGLSDYYETILSKSFFYPREQAEKNPNVKQIIPYCVLWHDGKVLTYKRSNKGGEERLHGNWSIGFGGHVSQEDKPNYSIVYQVEPINKAEDTYSFAIERELLEECNLYDHEYGIMTNHYDPVGLIYDPSNEVGRVHFGFVEFIDVMNIAGISFSDEIADTEWLTPDTLTNSPMDKFENWSNIVINELLMEGYLNGLKK